MDTLTTYVVHGAGADEWEPISHDYRRVDHVVQAAGYEFEIGVRGERPTVVFKDAEGKTVGAFAQWDYFEREGGVAVRDLPRKEKTEVPKHR